MPGQGAPGPWLVAGVLGVGGLGWPWGGGVVGLQGAVVGGEGATTGLAGARSCSTPYCLPSLTSIPTALALLVQMETERAMRRDVDTDSRMSQIVAEAKDRLMDALRCVRGWGAWVGVLGEVWAGCV